MTSDDLLEAFRLDVDDREDPPLWSDEEIYGYLDDAQKMFCRKTEGIEDARTVDVCQLSIVPGTEWYEKSPLVLKVRSASRTDTGDAVCILTPENAAKQGYKWRAGEQGPVKVLVDGLSKGVFRAWPMPNETVTINMTVFRLPLDSLADGSVQELEVDEQHHIHLLLWVKYRAYSKHDADTFDARAAVDNEQRFYAYCAEARKEQERARRQSGVVAYGGL